MKRLLWVGLFAAATTVTLGCTFDPDASAKEVNADGDHGSPSDPNQDPATARGDCGEMGGDAMQCADMSSGSHDEPTDCWPRAFDECRQAGGCEERCAAHAGELCAPQPPPPSMDDCWPRAFQDCLGWGGTEEDCVPFADQLCYDDSNQPPRFGQP